MIGAERMNIDPYSPPICRIVATLQPLRRAGFGTLSLCAQDCTTGGVAGP
jgi:hypothetical protein